MKTTVPFDTLAYAKKLEEQGIKTEHAEVLAETLAEVLEVNFITKKDYEIKSTDLSQKIDLLRSDMNAKFSEVKSEIIKWVVGIAFAQSAFISILKFFPH